MQIHGRNADTFPTCVSLTLLSGAECSAIIKLTRTLSPIGSASGRVPFFGTVQTIRLLRNCRVAWLNKRPETEYLYLKIAKIMKSINDTAYGIDIRKLHPLQFTTYGQFGHHHWHRDLTRTEELRDVNLSFSIQLTDPNYYKGGSLQIANGRETITAPRNQGVITAYPAFLPHRVTPVWWGTRQSLVGWFTGKFSADTFQDSTVGRL
jgi:PKHD-type hydroxylase